MNSPVQQFIPARIEILTGAERGRTVSAVTPTFLIGREANCHLRLTGSGVSRHHCMLLLDGPAVRLRDLESLHGTFINSRRLCGETMLRDGDIVTVGDVVLRVWFAGSELFAGSSGLDDCPVSGEGALARDRCGVVVAQ